MQVQSDTTTMMVCWTLGMSVMVLVPRPDATMRSNQCRSSAGAYYTEVREGSFEYRKTMIFTLAMTTTARDKHPAESVHETLLGLAEYRDGCPDDMPGI